MVIVQTQSGESRGLWGKGMGPGCTQGTGECLPVVPVTSQPCVSPQSRSIGLNPLYVMLPCTLSASFAFMLPVATPPNAIVFTYGHLKVSDMVNAAPPPALGLDGRLLRTWDVGSRALDGHLCTASLLC